MNECTPNPCINGGTCINKMNGFQCICNEFWSGTYCDHPVNVCDSKPCLNNGSCTSLSNRKDYLCRCLSGKC